MVKMSVPRVLLVCLGNICRSPMAQGLFEHHARRLGCQAVIDSAGLADFHVGKRPDVRAIEAAKARSIDIAHLTARQVMDHDFYRFDQIFAMDMANLSDLRARQPQDSMATVALVMGLVDPLGGPAAVPDPYFGDRSGFETVIEMLDQAASAWAAQVTLAHKGG